MKGGSGTRAAMAIRPKGGERARCGSSEVERLSGRIARKPKTANKRAAKPRRTYASAAEGIPSLPLNCSAAP